MGCPAFCRGGLLGALSLGLSIVEAARIGEVAAGFPCSKFRKGVVKCGGGREPKILGSGNYGETWLVEEADSDEQVVIKLFFLGNGYLTGEDVPQLEEIKHKISSNVTNECLPAMLVYQGETVHPGAQRIRRCLGSNFGDASGPEPLYVKLRDAGGLTLSQYHGRLLLKGEWTVDIVRKVTKQILQGLEALASLPWVHHDFHPGNVMVRVEGGEPLVQIIDLGSSISAAKGNECEFSPGILRDFAPPEAMGGPKVCPDPLAPDDWTRNMPAAFDARAPAAYDGFSAGLTLIGVLFSVSSNDFFGAIVSTSLADEIPDISFTEAMSLSYQLWAKSLTDPSKGKALEAWEKEMRKLYAKNMMQYYAEKIDRLNLPYSEKMAMRESVAKNQTAVDAAYVAHLAQLREPVAVEFIQAAMKLASYDPLERPSVSELLKMQWMEDTVVANNSYETERLSALAHCCRD